MRATSRLVVAALALALGAASPAWAAPIDPATAAAARLLAEEGLARFDTGDYAAALDRFTRADELVHAPTMGLMVARSLVKLGRLVEASERYLAVTRLALAEGAPEGARAAQVNAAKERTELMPRIPKLELTLGDAPPGGVEVTLDGKPVPPALIGVKQPVDPGTHTIEARRGSLSERQQITLREGEARSLVLRPAAPAPPPTHPPPATPLEPLPPATPQKRSVQRIVGWVSIGVGGAAMVGGVATGIAALGARSDLDKTQGCRDGVCPEAARTDVDRYNALRLLTTAGLVVGGVGLGAGVVLLATAPAQAAPRAAFTPSVKLRIGPGNLGVEGTF